MRLYIFNIDGALTELKPEIAQTRLDQITPNRLGEQRVLPGVCEKIEQLKGDPANRFALATNRGGLESDRLAAANAGAHFEWAWDFF